MDDFDRFLVRAWSRVVSHGGAGTAEEIVTHLALSGDKAAVPEVEARLRKLRAGGALP